MTAHTETTPTAAAPTAAARVLGFEHLARRFPLIPRPRPVQRPLDEQLDTIADLARTPPERPDAETRVAAAHNLAALTAANCGHPNLARALCWRHHHRYTDHNPWSASTARLALEPLVNLARLHARAGHPDTAINGLESLLTATGHGDTAHVDGQPVDLGHIATTEDREGTRRWLWTVTLAEGVRALARAGHWDDALTHAERHRGIGATLLDGRQVAVLAHVLHGDRATAEALLTESVHREPWQHNIAHLLHVLVSRRPDAPARADGLTHLLADPRTGPDTAPGAFGVELLLAAAELADGEQRAAIRVELSRRAVSITDAALARAVLDHPARQHLPKWQLDHLAALVHLATPPTSPAQLARALADALTSHPGRTVARAVSDPEIVGVSRKGERL
jgi:hypothetical protein